MKRILTLLLLLIGLSVSLAAQENNTAVETASDAEATEVLDGGPELIVENMELDYGTIEQDSDPIRVFRLTNAGDAPLLITNARGSCGCTTPQREDWNTPIGPGETRELRVRYDTHRVGPFRKRVTLTHNASEDPTVLTIKGKVNPKAAEPEAVPAGESGLFNGEGR